MTVQTWVCRICGDPYVGEDKPSHCPFCGAEHKFIVEGTKYIEPVVGELTEKSRSNILEAIKLEVGNAEFYFCASNSAFDMELKKRFKALGKVESEHASLLSKMVGAAKPSISKETTACPKEDAALIQESHDREENAVKHYTQFLAEATELRVKEVFTAIVAIEKTHIELADSTKP